jgi:hypothetical protein
MEDGSKSKPTPTKKHVYKKKSVLLLYNYYKET